MDPQHFGPHGEGKGHNSGSYSSPQLPESGISAGQKKKKSVPREMSSKHKTLNSDTESSDEEENLVSPVPIAYPSSLSNSFGKPAIPAPPGRGKSPKDENGGTQSIEVPAPVFPDAQVKRGRGRPRKYPKEPEPKYPKRPRGRPRKNAVAGNSLKGACATFIEHSTALTQRLESTNMPQVVAQLGKGIALAQYIQQNINEDGTLEPSRVEYIESYAVK